MKDIEFNNSELNGQAEQRFHEIMANLSRMSDQDVHKLVSGLQERQLELEQQNEELYRAREKLEEFGRDFWDHYDFAPICYLTFNKSGEIIKANLTASNQLGLDRQKLINKSFNEFLASEDRESFRKHLKTVLKTSQPQTCELRLIKRNSAFFYGRLDSIVARDSNGEGCQCRTTINDITDRKQADFVVRMQRNLAVALSATSDLKKALRLCLKTAIKVGGFDSGGIYLVNINGDLELMYSKGLSPEFIKTVSCYEKDTPAARLVLDGKSICSTYQNINVEKNEIQIKEGLRAIAIIPIRHEGHIIACMNLASHTFDQTLQASMNAVKMIAAQIGSSIARAQIETAIRPYSRKNTPEIENSVKSLAHDLKSPLAGISGLLSVLKNEYSEKMDAAGRSYLDLIRNSLADIDRIIDERLEHVRDDTEMKSD